MGIEKRAEGTAIFVMAFSFAVGVFLSLVLLVMKDQRLIEEVEFSGLEDELQGVVQQPMAPGEHKRAWSQAVEGLVQVSNKVDNAVNGSYKFDACFLSNDECVLSSKAIRDEFQRVTFYHAPSSYPISKNHLSLYLVVPDGGMPSLLMRFVYVGENWISIEKVYILVDDEVVLEQGGLSAHVRRKTTSANLYEGVDLLMNQKMEVIERIAQAQTLAVRIEGSSGTENLDEDMLANARAQAKEALEMYQLMTKKLEEALAPSR